MAGKPSHGRGHWFDPSIAHTYMTRNLLGFVRPMSSRQIVKPQLVPKSPRKPSRNTLCWEPLITVERVEFNSDWQPVRSPCRSLSRTRVDGVETPSDRIQVVVEQVRVPVERHRG